MEMEIQSTEVNLKAIREVKRENKPNENTLVIMYMNDYYENIFTLIEQAIILSV